MKKRNVLSVFLVLISVGLLLSLIVIGGHINPNANNDSKNDTLQTPLNMAIVNEDNGVMFRNQAYNLGKEYITQLSNQKHLNCVVVPRGVAEAGLKNNNYQLVIFIPSNFSQKIVDINNPDPNKLNVQYEINAKTSTMKNRCQQEANQVLRDLNERLIDIYTLGIMGNLYNAQQQVNGIYHRQGNLASSYQSQLLTPISNFSQTFPDLQSNTKDVLQLNQSVQKDLQQSAQSGFSDDFGQIHSTNNSLTQLIQAQSQSDHNQAELIKQLMTVNQQVFNDQTQQFIKSMQSQNQQLSQAATNNANQLDDNLTKEFENYSQAYTAKITALQQDLAQQTQKAQQQNQQIIQKLHTTYGTNANNLTLGDFIKKNNPDLYQKLVKQSQDVSGLKQQYQQLPFAQLPQNISNVLSNSDRDSIQNSLSQINKCNTAINKTLHLTTNQQLKVTDNSKQLQVFNQLVSDIKNKQNQHNQPQVITLPNIQQMQGDTLTLQLPNDVTIAQANIKSSNVQITKENDHLYQLKVLQNNAAITLPLQITATNDDSGGTMATLTYQHQAAAPQKVTTQTTNNVKTTASANSNNASSTNSSNSANTSSTNEVSTTTKTQTIQNDHDRSFSVQFDIAKQMTSLQALSNKQQQLSEMIGNWVASYRDAANAAQQQKQLLTNNNINQMLAIPLDQSLDQVLTQASNQHLHHYRDMIAKLTSDAQQLDAQKQNYLQTLSTVGKQSQQNVKTAQAQLATLQNLQQKFVQLQQQSPTDAPNESHIDELQSLSQSLSSLDNSTRSLQSAINADAQQFNGVYTNFDQLNQQLATTENNGKSLQSKSINLQAAFKKELARSGDFTQSFVKVLNAGYQNGVPNEKLLSFIANPVKGQSQVMVTAKTQSYNMNLWTMIIAILAWFMAYAVHALRTWQKEQYFSRFNTQLSRHAVKIGSLLALSVITGIIIAAVAQTQLPIVLANRFLWFVMVISLTSLATLIAYLLITYGHTFGMGLIASMFVIFIFVQTQSSSILSKVNVLNLISTPMLHVVMLNNQTVLLTLLLVWVLLIASVLVGLFVPEPEQRNEVINHEEAN